MLNVTQHKTHLTKIDSFYFELLIMWCIIPAIKNPLHTLQRKHNLQCIHPNFTQTVPWLKQTDTYNLAVRQCAQVRHSPYTSLDMAVNAHKL
jgi:hypothetical protein